MTTVAVLAEPPVEECVPRVLPDSFDSQRNVAFYRAMLGDVCAAIERGGGNLLVNYRQPEAVPDGVDPEALLSSYLDDELEEPGDVRYEVQVGESYAGRVGNTLTHLLEQEQLKTVAVAEPTAIFLRREHIGSAAMKLRSSDVVLGPAPGGRVYFAAFGEPIDFTDSFATPAVETLATRGIEADHDVTFLPMTPVVMEPSDLLTAVSLLRARERAGRLIPRRTLDLVEEWGVRVGENGVHSDSS